MAAIDAALIELGWALLAAGYCFTTPTPATHALVNARPANAWAHTLADVFGWSRPFRDGVVPPALVALMDAAGVLAPAGLGHRALVRFSTLDGLLLAHSAYPTTGADAVFFGPDTYRFCAAIEALPAQGVKRAVDIGTGAGPGALVLARRYPAADVRAVDINPAALRLAGVNAAVNDLAITTLHSDLLRDAPGPFDLIVSNPPYLVDPGARAYRHGGGPLGAELSLAILGAAWDALAPGGTLLLYTGSAIVDGCDRFYDAARARLPAEAITGYREIDPDVFGEELATGAYVMADRIAAVALTVQKNGG